MGRSKAATPVRRETAATSYHGDPSPGGGGGGGGGGGDISGRRSSWRWPSGVGVATTGLLDSRDRLVSPSPPNNRRLPPARELVSFIVDEDEEEEDEEEMEDSMVTPGTALGVGTGEPATGRRPSKKARTTKMKTKKGRSKARKAVRFPTDASELAQIIPVPELQLLHFNPVDNGDAATPGEEDEGRPTTRLVYQWDDTTPHSEEDGCDSTKYETASWLVVRSIPLPETDVVVATGEAPSPLSQSPPIPPRRFKLHSSRVLIDLWQHYKLPGWCDAGSPATGFSVSSFLRSALLPCTNDGLVSVYLDRDDDSYDLDSDQDQLRQQQPSWALRVALTARALEVCRPCGRRALAEKGPRSGPVAPAKAVRAVLEALVPDPSSSGDSHAADDHNDSGRASGAAAAVTARRVYALTDNRQLQRAIGYPADLSNDIDGEDSFTRTDAGLTLTVPGLLPTLRGYQAHAVRWMLGRERHPPPSDEWELSWMVLRSHHNKDQLKPRSTGPVWHSLPRARKWLDQRPGGKVLLFCPVTGWLASTYQDARVMTLGVDDDEANSPATAAPKGGILAESMGLGKTVEVLACILANPRPYGTLEPTSVTTQRRLDFNREVPQPYSGETTEPSTPGAVAGAVVDMREFGDAEDSSEDEKSVRAHWIQTSDESRPVPITPEQIKLPEIWVDESVLGSCICGRLVGFSHRRTAGQVIICESCREPMHQECAAFLSSEEKGKIGKPLRYRQRFSSSALDCLLCDESICPCCVAKSGAKVPSRATIIITPPAILNQWEREINQHARLPNGEPLKTLVYWGLEASCKSTEGTKSLAMKLVHPRHLADADIVLTTFDALVGDLNHSDDNRFIAASRSSEESNSFLRRRKRYRAIPTPLLSVDWWRVCLDEAQRVETPTAASARMALKLSAGRRWCVSGTPIGRGKLEDLYGLLLFLRTSPFSCKQWFHKSLSPSFGNIDEKITHLLRNVFWRSTKTYPLVLKQMGVPQQVERKVMLHQSSIERHFYERQLNETISTAGEISDRDSCGKKRKASQLELLAEHLHRLRAACCHPQVGSSGISALKRSRPTPHKKDGKDSPGLGSRVMSMNQILDRFIDDAKLKCEEAQRLSVMHTNAMAAIWKLKVQAKERGIEIQQSDAILLANSCQLYLEALDIAEENAAATAMVGEAALSGSTGFCYPRLVFRRGSCTVAWRGVEQALLNPQADIEFEGPPRKITELRLRPIRDIPLELAEATSTGFRWTRLRPRECVLQVASGALNGAFVDVTTLVLSDVDSHTHDEIPWTTETGFRTNKSKTWRLIIKSFYQNDWKQLGTGIGSGVFTGLEVELFEADIAADPLQRLHGLHNATMAFESFLEARASELDEPEGCLKLTRNDVCLKIQSMSEESKKIETLYMELARSTHMECMSRLRESSVVRKEKESKLLSFNAQAHAKPRNPLDSWEDCWWDDFLVTLLLSGSVALQHNICEKIRQDLDGMITNRLEIDSMDRDKIKFPEFSDIQGFRTALQMRIRRIRTGLENEKGRTSRVATAVDSVASKDDPFVQPRSTRFHCKPGQHGRCMEAIAQLSDQPKQAEVFENSHCHVCKADWFQTGPKCTHCELGEELRDLSPDLVTVAVLSAIYGVVRSSLGASLMNSTSSSTCIAERARLFFEVLEAEKREKALAYRVWRVHLDLLNDLDELNQCKSSMRLTFEGEDLTKLTGDQLNAVVAPFDLQTRYQDHAGKQAMALGELRRSKDSLRYLRHLTEPNNDSISDDCAVCQESFSSEKMVAVLRCGHRFCLQPCLEQLQALRSGVMIQCPMRCRVVSDPKDVMIATCKSKVDGSANHRTVKGSWGTKVTRLVSDLLDVRDHGEKGVVFSQWEDMLDIVQQALSENGIEYVRASSAKRIGDCVRRFRSECTVLLLNVKNGAEGLTLLEATHVFMVEPLLNCGLDSQAINRVHRIGQTKKTYVWRYLMADTIELKIDQMRMDHEGEQVEDSINESRKWAFKAGGIDGGFQTQEELLDLLR